jgi:hypothetical protein
MPNETDVTSSNPLLLSCADMSKKKKKKQKKKRTIIEPKSFGPSYSKLPTKFGTKFLERKMLGVLLVGSPSVLLVLRKT